MRPLVLLFLPLFLPPPLFAQSVHYVDAGAGGGDGTSWADAYTDLQAALAAAQPGDEIWVAEGTYVPGADRDASFRLRSGVALYGGFDGTETHRDQRDWTAHETVLSGDIGVPGDDADNTYHVVTGSGTDATAVLDGFTVTGARADGLFPKNRGGGMRNVAGSPTVRHCVFRSNRAFRSPDARDGFGGGMFNENGSSPTLLDVRFEGNYAAGSGGGMANRVGSSPTLTDVVFVENEAGILGGGMTNEAGSSPTLVRARFERNRSDGWTGGMDNYQNAAPRLYNVVFAGNAAGQYGGGMVNDTGSDALLVNVVFVGNVAENATEAGAAALQNNGSSPTLVGVTFAGNAATDGAGALGHRGAGTVALRNAVLWGNGIEIVDESGGLDVSHALIEGGFAGGTDVLDADPLFVRPSTDEDVGDLRLQPGSPALDAGDAAHLPADAADLDGDGDTAEPVPLDLAGEMRVQAGALDLGAYEGAAAVVTEPGASPVGLRSYPVFPNPARGPVAVPFFLDAPGWMSVRVTDVLGREVARLADTPFAAGFHTVTWGAGDAAAGLYFVVLTAPAARAVRLVTLLP